MGVRLRLQIPWERRKMEREEIIRKIHKLARPVDLVMESALKPRIRKKVQSEMVRVA